MPISFVGAALTNPPGATTGGTAAMPAGIQTDDLMLCYASINKVPIVPTHPAGWTLLDTITETAITTFAYSRVAVGDGGTAPTVQSDVSGQWRLDVAAYRGVDTTNPFIARGGRIESGSSSTTVHQAPALTNDNAGAWGVFCGAFRQLATPTDWLAGTGLTERLDADVGLTTTANMAQALMDTAGPIATGTYTFSGTSRQNGAAAGSAQATMWAALLRPSSGSTPADLDDLRLGGSTVGLRVGASTPSAAYLGSTKVWP